MMYDAGSHYGGLSAEDVDAPRRYPLDCAVADIATVVKGSQWGAWSFNGKRYASSGCQRWASNGWVIEHKISGRWYVLAEGDELPRHIPDVPHNIAVDLIRGLG
jgi:hypothetical protein